ncbi:MAG TPA: hypothetical protein VFE51_09190 [Verrucomicrobiae bacterium]|nr:hypothetical protein [Verrucomicrobiae bacterium]
MKIIIALGGLVLSILLVVALRYVVQTRSPVVVTKPASVAVKPIFEGASDGHSAFHALRETQQTQSSDTILLATVEAETDPDRRSDALERVVESIPDGDWRTTLDLLQHDVSPAGAELRPLLVRRWAESDAPAAASWTLQLSESPVRCAALEQVAIAWANSDLSAATSWVNGLPEGDSRQAAILSVGYEAARAEPVAALDLASTLPPTRERDNLLVHAVGQWSGTDSSSAAAWAMNVGDPGLRERLVAAVAVASAEQDGALGANLAASALGAGGEQDRAAVSIVQRWAQNAPQAAADWVSQFQDLPCSDAAAQSLVSVWTNQDPDAAGEWVRGLPSGSLRAVGMTAYAQALADRDTVPR